VVGVDHLVETPALLDRIDGLDEAAEAIGWPFLLCDLSSESERLSYCALEVDG